MAKSSAAGKTLSNPPKGMAKSSAAGKTLSDPPKGQQASGKAKTILKESAERHSAALIRLADR